MFADVIYEKIVECSNPTVLGLDPRVEYVPDSIREKTKNDAAAVLEFNMKLMDFNEWVDQKNRFSRISIYYIIILIILFLGNFSVKPSFIYFQF